MQGAQHSSDDNKKSKNKKKETDISQGSTVSEGKKGPVEGTSTVGRAERSTDSVQKNKSGERSELTNIDSDSSDSKTSDESVNELGGENRKELIASSDKNWTKEPTAKDDRNASNLSGASKQAVVGSKETTKVEGKQIANAKKPNLMRESSKENPVEVSSDSESNDSSNSNEEDRAAKMLLGKWGEPKYKSKSPCMKMEVKGSPKNRSKLMMKSFRIPKYTYDEQKREKGERDLKKVERRSLEDEFEKQAEQKGTVTKNVYKGGEKPFERDSQKQRETNEMSVWNSQSREVIELQKQNMKMAKHPDKSIPTNVGDISGSASATEKGKSGVNYRGPIAKAASFEDIIQEGVREHGERLKRTPEKIRGQGGRGDTQGPPIGYVVQKQKSREMTEQEKQNNPFARVNQLPRTAFSDKKTEKEAETGGKKRGEGSGAVNKDLILPKVDIQRVKSEEVQGQKNESGLLKKIKDLGRTIETLKRGEGSSEQLASILGSTEELATEFRQRAEAATALALKEASKGDKTLEGMKFGDVVTGGKESQSEGVNMSKQEIKRIKQSCEFQLDEEGTDTARAKSIEAVSGARQTKVSDAGQTKLSGAGQMKGGDIINKISLNMGRLQSLVKGKLGQLGKSEDKSRDSTPEREVKDGGKGLAIQKQKTAAMKGEFKDVEGSGSSAIQKAKIATNKGNLGEVVGSESSPIQKQKIDTKNGSFQDTEGSGSSGKSNGGGDFKNTSSGAQTTKLTTINETRRESSAERGDQTQISSSEALPVGNSQSAVQKKNPVDKGSLGKDRETTAIGNFDAGKGNKGSMTQHQVSKRVEKDLPEKRKAEKAKEIIDGKKNERESKDNREKLQTNMKGKNPDKKLELKGSTKPKSPAVLGSPANLQNMFEFTKVKTVSPNEQNARSKGGMKRGVDGGEKSARKPEKKLKIDPSKVRYANQRQPSKEAFTPAKDDILGGILGRSEMMRSIDSKADKKDANKEKKDKSKHESDSLKVRFLKN